MINPVQFQIQAPVYSKPINNKHSHISFQSKKLPTQNNNQSHITYYRLSTLLQNQPFNYLSEYLQLKKPSLSLEDIKPLIKFTLDTSTKRLYFKEQYILNLFKEFNIKKGNRQWHDILLHISKKSHEVKPKKVYLKLCGVL